MTGSFPVLVLMKSAPAIIATALARATSRKRAQLAGGEDRLEVGRAAGRAKRPDLVVERRPVAGQHVRAGDDDVDLLRTRLDRGLDLRQPLRKRREARRKAGRDRGNRDTAARAGPRPRSRRTHGRRRPAPTWSGTSAMPRASSRSGRTGWRALAQRRRTRPGVSSPIRVVRSISVMARSSQPACWAFLTLRRAGNGRGAALHRAPVDPDLPDPPEVEWHPRVPPGLDVRGRIDTRGTLPRSAIRGARCSHHLHTPYTNRNRRLRRAMSCGSRNSGIRNRPARKPPAWAQNATPPSPPWAIVAPPSWSRNQ